MKIRFIQEPHPILFGEDSTFNYFAWPTVAKLKNGRLAVVCSGFRRAHICPFGKAAMAISEDEGNTFTLPTPIIDTPLDDRDAGILAYGEKSVVITSFNNRVDFQKGVVKTVLDEKEKAFRNAYLDTVSREAEDRYFGSHYRISHDNGVTWSPLYTSPVTSPHGPCVRQDGKLLWIGKPMGKNQPDDEKNYESYLIGEDGVCRHLGTIPCEKEEDGNVLWSEAHAVSLPDGKIIVHLRNEKYTKENKNFPIRFTIYQCESLDGGQTFTTPHRILENFGGAPSHLLLTSKGVLVASLGFRNDYRNPPFGVRLAVSFDGGKTYDTEMLYRDAATPDVGYASTAELSDGSFYTGVYAKKPSKEQKDVAAEWNEPNPSVIMGCRYTLEP
ncbi:MAG: glycoside hydrolase [Clostridia bacterium]|nr:glycoside hydrolase [Clostridia bacterium]